MRFSRWLRWSSDGEVFDSPHRGVADDDGMANAMNITKKKERATGFRAEARWLAFALLLEGV